jgi:hypothetical protein
MITRFVVGIDRLGGLVIENWCLVYEALYLLHLPSSSLGLHVTINLLTLLEHCLS